MRNFCWEEFVHEDKGSSNRSSSGQGVWALQVEACLKDQEGEQRSNSSEFNSLPSSTLLVIATARNREQVRIVPRIKEQSSILTRWNTVSWSQHKLFQVDFGPTAVLSLSSWLKMTGQLILNILHMQSVGKGKGKEKREKRRKKQQILNQE